MYFFLDSAYYYNNDITPHGISNETQLGFVNSNTNTDQSSRSPLAATRANSLASANSPTESGSACLKTENIFTHDLNLA